MKQKLNDHAADHGAWKESLEKTIPQDWNPVGSGMSISTKFLVGGCGGGMGREGICFLQLSQLQ
jgi:hypothetical protein